MFIIRSVSLSDIDALYELSGIVSFLNLPNDRTIIEKRVTNSVKTFKNPSKDFSQNYYFFVIEDTVKKSIVGTSMIHAKHGTESEPNFYLKVSSEHKFSQTINTGFVHGTLKLGWTTDGPTELGSLVIKPEYRGNPEKIGKQLSYSRFLYIGLNRNQFKDKVHVELMPPLDSDGNSPLWEAIGKRFMNMDYQNADALSRKNKEFILSLFPSDTIYITLLPLEAKNAIGRVGPDTIPVQKMLEKIGFKYVNEVDPFDGGPHYECHTDEIEIIKNMNSGFAQQGQIDPNKIVSILASMEHEEHPFYATKLEVNFSGKNIIVAANQFKDLNLKENQELKFIQI